MREVKVLSWCDRCFMEDDARVESTHTFTAGLVAGEMTHPPVKLLEVCDIHAKPVLEMMETLAEIGQTPARTTLPRPHISQEKRNLGRVGGLGVAAPNNPIIDCPAGCGAQIRRKSAVNHMWNLHLGGLKNRPPQPDICPDCRTTSLTPQGMAAHRGVIHNWTPLDDALAAWDAGGQR